MIWFALVFVFLIVESLTLNLVTIWFAFGSVCAFVSTYFTDNIIIQIIIFVVTSALSLILTKPLLERYIRKTEREKTNLDRIIGSVGLVIEDIKKHNNGRVKIEGKTWMATSKEEIKKGTEVEILNIEGAKLIVRKKGK